MNLYFNHEINYRLNESNKLNLSNKKFKTNNKQIDFKTTYKSISKNNTNSLIYNNNDNNNIEDSKINKINFKNITIHLVYQYYYKNEKSVTGFGDFIRAIYFMLQFSEKINVCVDFHINKHNIKKYLKYFDNSDKIDECIENNIIFFDKTNYQVINKNNVIDYNYIDIYNDLLNHINTLPIYDNNIYLYLVNHPQKKLISEKHKKKVKKLIEPTAELESLVDKYLFNLNLKKQNYVVIHIRSWDTSFSNNVEDLSKINFNYLCKTIKNIIFQHKLDILLLTNNNLIKLNIIKYFPNIKCNINEICHTCDNNSSDEQLVNTLKDFYILSHSSYIYCFSVYEHGSGFSKWCAVTYDIPYVCFYLS
jgi:hypothetical protein